MVNSSLLGTARQTSTTDIMSDRLPIVRPSHQDVFLGVATLIAQLSCDAQTKCGCVLVRNNRIVSTGYNSFPRETSNELLPNTRPLKYDWMVHAEKNAIANARQDVANCTAYINARPCFRCLTQELWQHGIENVVYYNGVYPQSTTNHDELLSTFMYQVHGRMSILEVEFNFSDFLLKSCGNIIQSSFENTFWSRLATGLSDNKTA